MSELIIDDREKQLISTLTLKAVDFKKQRLQLGDIAVLNNDDNEISIYERKTLADFAASMKDGRYLNIIKLANSRTINVKPFLIIEGKTTAKDNKVDIKEDTGKLASIRSDFASRPEDLKQLVFFNNVVSSFLTTQTKCDGGSKGCKDSSTGRNVAAFYQEMENSAYLDANDKKLLNDSANKAGLKKEQDQNKNKNGSELSIEDINKILKYSSEKP